MKNQRNTNFDVLGYCNLVWKDVETCKTEKRLKTRLLWRGNTSSEEGKEESGGSGVVVKWSETGVQ